MAEEVIETGELDQLKAERDQLAAAYEQAGAEGDDLRIQLARERQETSNLLSQELLLRRELMEYQSGELRELRAKLTHYERSP